MESSQVSRAHNPSTLVNTIPTSNPDPDQEQGRLGAAQWCVASGGKEQRAETVAVAGPRPRATDQ